MDHMMPEMDGLEATAIIRAMDGRGDMPIIALTANAVSGMKTMFLQNGFNDFLPKPIETAKLDALLQKWLPAGKRRRAPEAGPPPESDRADERGQARDDAAPAFTEAVQLPEIEGLDARAGLAQIGGKPGRYLNLLETFCQDARARLPLLAKAPEEAERKTFTTQVHALKGALASIGAADLATIAARLEEAARNGELSAIGDSLHTFRKTLTMLLERLEAALAFARPEDGREDGAKGQAGQPEGELLTLLRDALEQEDIDAVDKALEGLKALPLTPKMRDAVFGISELVLRSEFRQAADIAEAVL
jgi:HPt (histidine-containing phosphotransfer) domain-containing protein